MHIEHRVSIVWDGHGNFARPHVECTCGWRIKAMSSYSHAARSAQKHLEVAAPQEHEPPLPSLMRRQTS